MEAYEANYKALIALHHALSPNDLCTIGDLGIVKEAWEFLEKTYKNVSSLSNDEGSHSEQNSSPRSKVLVVIGRFQDLHREFGSDREEGGEEEDLQEAFNQLYIELAETTKAFEKETTSLIQENKKLKEVENYLKEKIDSLELEVYNFDENQPKCLVDELLKINSNLSNENDLPSHNSDMWLEFFLNLRHYVQKLGHSLSIG